MKIEEELTKELSNFECTIQETSKRFVIITSKNTFYLSELEVIEDILEADFLFSDQSGLLMFKWRNIVTA